MKYLFQLFLLFVFISPAFAANKSPAGEWMGYYEDTQIPGAKVRVILDDTGILNAYYEVIYPKKDEKIPATCEDCPGKFANQPLKGLPMLWDLKPEKGQWVDGDGFSLERNQTFAATAWLSDDGDTLFIRGKVGLFSKTQQLKRLTSG